MSVAAAVMPQVFIQSPICMMIPPMPSEEKPLLVVVVVAATVMAMLPMLASVDR